MSKCTRTQVAALPAAAVAKPILMGVEKRGNILTRTDLDLLIPTRYDTRYITVYQTRYLDRVLAVTQKKNHFWVATG